MKALPLRLVSGGYEYCRAEEATHLQLLFPGPLPHRILPVSGSGWSWNGDTKKPTLSPSILSVAPPHRCHSYVREGKVEFLADCSHEFANKTVDLLEVEGGGT